jgi:hypothetical protein
MRCPDDLVILDKQRFCWPPVAVFELEYETTYELKTFYLPYYPEFNRDPSLESLRHCPFINYLDTPGATCLREQLEIVRFSGQDRGLLHLRLDPEVQLGLTPSIDILVQSGGHSCLKFRFRKEFKDIHLLEWLMWSSFSCGRSMGVDTTKCTPR